MHDLAAALRLRRNMDIRASPPGDYHLFLVESWRRRRAIGRAPTQQAPRVPLRAPRAGNRQAMWTRLRPSARGPRAAAPSVAGYFGQRGPCEPGRPLARVGPCNADYISSVIQSGGRVCGSLVTSQVAAEQGKRAGQPGSAQVAWALEGRLTGRN